jgi:hypothetical protein
MANYFSSHSVIEEVLQVKLLNSLFKYELEIISWQNKLNFLNFVVNLLDYLFRHCFWVSKLIFEGFNFQLEVSLSEFWSFIFRFLAGHYHLKFFLLYFDPFYRVITHSLSSQSPNVSSLVLLIMNDYFLFTVRKISSFLLSRKYFLSTIYLFLLHTHF